MSVHRLPPRYIGSGDYPARQVIVAPCPLEDGVWIAWVLGKRGPVVLERADHNHVVKDARLFGDTHGLGVAFIDYPLVKVGRDDVIGANGVVYIATSERDGGSWDVIHESRSGDSSAVLGNRFSQADAEALARQEGRRIGATVFI